MLRWVRTWTSGYSSTQHALLCRSAYRCTSLLYPYTVVLLLEPYTSAPNLPQGSHYSGYSGWWWVSVSQKWRSERHCTWGSGSIHMYYYIYQDRLPEVVVLYTCIITYIRAVYLRRWFYTHVLLHISGPCTWGGGSIHMYYYMCIYQGHVLEVVVLYTSIITYIRAVYLKAGVLYTICYYIYYVCIWHTPNNCNLTY